MLPLAVAALCAVACMLCRAGSFTPSAIASMAASYTQFDYCLPVFMMCPVGSSNYCLHTNSWTQPGRNRWSVDVNKCWVRPSLPGCRDVAAVTTAKLLLSHSLGGLGMPCLLPLFLGDWALSQGDMQCLLLPLSCVCVGVSTTNTDCPPCMLALFVFIARCLDSSLQHGADCTVKRRQLHHYTTGPPGFCATQTCFIIV
ncbi:hypothetical protein LSAT2_028357 [Lamellibrachia satsuma]|nr:hypothetical protein LSAT2_028357 [Lamellibrachia satsuma]